MGRESGKARDTEEHRVQVSVPGHSPRNPGGFRERGVSL